MINLILLERTQKIKVQEKPKSRSITNSSFWNDQTTTAKDLEDLNGLVQTMDKAEIKSLCTENPELVSDYLLAFIRVMICPIRKIANYILMKLAHQFLTILNLIQREVINYEKEKIKSKI